MNLDAPEEWEMLPKTDYTYAKSMSYNKTYEEGYKTPNMSRPPVRGRHHYHEQSSDSASSSTSHYNLRSRRQYEPLNFSVSEHNINEHANTSQFLTKSTISTNTPNFEKVKKVEEKFVFSKVFYLITTILYSIITRFQSFFHYLIAYSHTNKNSNINRVDNKINDRITIIDAKINDRTSVLDAHTSNKTNIINTAYRNDKSRFIKNTNSAYNTKTSTFKGDHNDINDSVEAGAGDAFTKKSKITHHFVQRNILSYSDDESESIRKSRRSLVSSLMYFITWLPMKVYSLVTHSSESHIRQRRGKYRSLLWCLLLLFLLSLPLLYYNYALLSTTSSSIAQNIPSKQQVTETLNFLTTSAKNLLYDYVLLPVRSVLKVFWEQLYDLFIVAVTWWQRNSSDFHDTKSKDNYEPINDQKHGEAVNDAGIKRACDCSLEENVMNIAIAKALLPFNGLINKISELEKEVSELSQLINVKENQCVQRYEKLKLHNEATIAELQTQQQSKPFISELNEKFISREALPQLLLEHRSDEKEQLEVWLASKLKDFQGQPKHEEGLSKEKENSLFERTALVVKEDLDRWKLDMEKKVKSVHREAISVPISTQNFYTKKEVDMLLESKIQKYDADKTGLFDFALETSGGALVSTRCSKTFREGKSQLSIFGIPLFYAYNSPRTIIQPGNLPGECWAFQGGIGFAVVKLSAKVFIDKVSIEHVHKNMTRFGNIDSAPKDFSVWGLAHEEDVDGFMLGNFTYDQHSQETLQIFHIEPEYQKQSFEVVELRIYNNHGNPYYTCVYRFRVHGIPDKKSPAYSGSPTSSSRWWW